MKTVLVDELYLCTCSKIREIITLSYKYRYQSVQHRAQYCLQNFPIALFSEKFTRLQYISVNNVLKLLIVRQFMAIIFMNQIVEHWTPSYTLSKWNKIHFTYIFKSGISTSGGIKGSKTEHFLKNLSKNSFKKWENNLKIKLKSFVIDQIRKKN